MRQLAQRQQREVGKRQTSEEQLLLRPTRHSLNNNKSRGTSQVATGMWGQIIKNLSLSKYRKLADLTYN